MAQKDKGEKPAKMWPRIGRWEETEGGRVTLIASRCASCGEIVFPERPICPRCRSEQIGEIRLEGPAKLYSYTVVHQLPSGFPAPMVAGYGLFPEGVQVFAPIDATPEQLMSGPKLELHTGLTRVDADGDKWVTYRFRPVES